MLRYAFHLGSMFSFAVGHGHFDYVPLNCLQNGMIFCGAFKEKIPFAAAVTLNPRQVV